MYFFFSQNNPWCFHPNRPSGAIEYIVDNIEKTTLGAKVRMCGEIEGAEER